MGSGERELVRSVWVQHVLVRASWPPGPRLGLPLASPSTSMLVTSHFCGGFSVASSLEPMRRRFGSAGPGTQNTVLVRGLRLFQKAPISIRRAKG
jgi:hypothetical protein